MEEKHGVRIHIYGVISTHEYLHKISICLPLCACLLSFQLLCVVAFALASECGIELVAWILFTMEAFVL